MDSVGTIITLITFVAQCYSRCQKVSESFYNLHVDLLSLHEALLMVKQNVPEGENLHGIQIGCDRIVKDIAKLLTKYESIGTTKKKLWHKLKWHFEDIAQLRSRLAVQVGMLNLCVRLVQCPSHECFQCNNSSF